MKPIRKMPGRILLFTVFLIFSGAVLPGCGRGRIVTLRGSATLAPLAWKWAREFMSSHPGITVRVESSESSAGIAVMISGGADIGMTSRQPAANEVQAARRRLGVEPRIVPVALDAVAVFVSMKNPLDRMALDTLRDIYLGKITDWKKAGSKKGPLIAYGYARGSGSRDWFLEQVLGGAGYFPNVGELPDTDEVVAAVMSEPRAVGYGSSAFVKGVRIVRVARKSVEWGFDPSDAAVSSGKYPLTRKLFFCLSARPSPDTAQFLDWVLSPEGQRMCRDAGYFPVRPVKRLPVE